MNLGAHAALADVGACPLVRLALLLRCQRKPVAWRSGHDWCGWLRTQPC